ncbi:unnamed protein product [Euphydryas editha]|uniref:Uncharacterized protein n=1 Tax=Euphydryas editha TaxID=104508 RepID=A0AAU9UNT8_EUPED|nr:unnamed protein product [Euphydryas editha]
MFGLDFVLVVMTTISVFTWILSVPPGSPKNDFDIQVNWRRLETAGLERDPQLPFLKLYSLEGVAKDHYSSLFQNLSSYKSKLNPRTGVISTRQSRDLISQHLLLEEFRLSTIRMQARGSRKSCCGAQIVGGKLFLNNCRGRYKLITLYSMNMYSCKRLQGFDVIGPSIIENKTCFQQLVSIPECDEGFRKGFQFHNCALEVAETKTNQSSILVLCLFLFSIVASVSSALFLKKLKMLKASKQIIPTLKGEFSYNFLTTKGELIHYAGGTLRSSGFTLESRLSYKFSTAPWELKQYNRQFCLQNSCSSIIECQEDILPFSPSNVAVRTALGMENSELSYATCKNMKAYCMLSNGCFLMGFTIYYSQEEVFQVFSIGSTKTIRNEQPEPTNYKSSSNEVDLFTGLDDMYYLENGRGESWLCSKDLYSHFPLPESLGDFRMLEKVGHKFISEFVHCATDSFKEVQCTYPESFIRNIDKFCLKNNEKEIGYVARREGDTILWEPTVQYLLTLSCSVDLELVVSSEGCSKVEIMKSKKAMAKDEVALLVDLVNIKAAFSLGDICFATLSLDTKFTCPA